MFARNRLLLVACLLLTFTSFLHDGISCALNRGGLERRQGEACCAYRSQHGDSSHSPVLSCVSGENRWAGNR